MICFEAPDSTAAFATANATVFNKRLSVGLGMIYPLLNFKSVQNNKVLPLAVF